MTFPLEFPAKLLGIARALLLPSKGLTEIGQHTIIIGAARLEVQAVEAQSGRFRVMHQVVCKIGQGYRRVAQYNALALSGLALIVGVAALSPSLQAQQVSEADVQAALKRCSQCHGPNLQMSKLDLSTRDGMLKGGEKGPAIVPGDAAASPLYRRISGLQTPAMPMAPVPALNAQEIELVKNWINQGRQVEPRPHRRSLPPRPLERRPPTPAVIRLARSRMRIVHGGRSRSLFATRRLPFATQSGATTRSTPLLPICGNRRAWRARRKRIAGL